MFKSVHAITTSPYINSFKPYKGNVQMYLNLKSSLLSKCSKPYKGNVQIANTLLFFGLFYLFEQIYYT